MPLWSQDTANQRFSISLDKAYSEFFLAKPADESTELQYKKFQPSFIAPELNFRFKASRLGVSIGFQRQSRSFFIKYPENASAMNGFVGSRHSDMLTLFPLHLSYKILEKGHYKVFLRPGIAAGMLKGTIHEEYNYPAYPAFAEKYRWTDERRAIIQWAMGINAERNLYKRDVYLSLKLGYMREIYGNIEQTNTVNRITGSMGINIMVSNILYKDKINTLKKNSR